MKKEIIRSLAFIIIVSGAFINGLVFESNRMKKVDSYTFETNVKFRNSLQYVREYFVENGTYPDDISEVTSPEIVYEKFASGENGFFLGVNFPKKSFYSKYLNLDDEYTQRIKNPLGVSEYNGGTYVK